MPVIDKPLSEVTALVVDNGLNPELAAKLAESYRKVYYCVPQEDEFPRIQNWKIGEGLGKFERVRSILGPHFREIDLFVFPDLGFGETQVELEAMGKLVWGARMGEEIEQEREAFKKLLVRLGLPVGDWKAVTGFKALRDYLQTQKDVFVKMSRWRGNWETLGVKSYELAKAELDEREHSLSGVAEDRDLKFVIEQKLTDKVEMATDAYCIDGQHPNLTLAGIEIKDKLYVGTFVERDRLPEPLRRVNDTLAPVMRNYGYRGFWSPECMIGRDHEPFVGDPCTRSPSPPGETYLEAFTNLAEIIYEGAKGNCIDPKPVAKYVVEAVISSPWGDSHWNVLRFPDKYRRNVKLREACFTNGEFKTIPQNFGLASPGAVIGWGDTLDDAYDMVREVADKLEGTQVSIADGAFEAAQEQIKKAGSYGLKLF